MEVLACLVDSSLPMCAHHTENRKVKMAVEERRRETTHAPPPPTQNMQQQQQQSRGQSSAQFSPLASRRVSAAASVATTSTLLPGHFSSPGSECARIHADRLALHNQANSEVSTAAREARLTGAGGAAVAAAGPSLFSVGTVTRLLVLFLLVPLLLRRLHWADCSSPLRRRRRCFCRLNRFRLCGSLVRRSNLVSTGRFRCPSPARDALLCIRAREAVKVERWQIMRQDCSYRF